VGAKTMLTGELGNLSLNPGGLANLATYLQAGRWPQWWNEAKASLRRSDVRLRGVLMNSFWPWMPEAGETFLKRRFLGVSGAPETTFLCPEWLRWSQAAPRPLRVRDSAALRLQMIRRHEVGTVRKAAIADAGVEELDPMADRRLIEFGLRLPPEHLFRDGVARPLARTALADRLPASVLQSSTRGLQGADWFTKISRESASQALETISSSAGVKDLLDITALKTAIESWPDGDWNSAACVTKYRTGLTRALSAGLFIKSLEHAA